MWSLNKLIPAPLMFIIGKKARWQFYHLINWAKNGKPFLTPPRPIFGAEFAQSAIAKKGEKHPVFFENPSIGKIPLGKYSTPMMWKPLWCPSKFFPPKMFCVKNPPKFWEIFPRKWGHFLLLGQKKRFQPTLQNFPQILLSNLVHKLKHPKGIFCARKSVWKPPKHGPFKDPPLF